jgi:putative spermidine/putrescine transport system substrate-binding protein
MTTMTTAKTIDAVLAAKLPTVSSAPTFPSAAQTTQAKTTLTKNWASAVK